MGANNITADKFRSLNKMSKPRMSFHFTCMSVEGMIEEYQFHKERKWRFDYYHPETKQAYEYEGIFSQKSRHTNLNGFTNDCDKYNEAQRLGIKVFRFTAKNIKSLINYLPKTKNK